IYFDEPTQRRIRHQLYELLADGGYLFLGHSENWTELGKHQRMIAHKNAIFQKAKYVFHGANLSSRSGSTSAVSVMPDISITTGHADSGDRANKLSDSVAIIPDQNNSRGISASVSGKAVSAMPAEELYQRGIEAYHGKDFKQAETLLNAACAKQPESIDFRLARAFLKADQGLIEKAWSECETILQFDNLCADAYYLKGVLLLQKSEFSDAETCFRRCIYCDPHHLPGLYFLTMALEEQTLWDAVKKNCIQILDLLKTRQEFPLTKPWQTDWSLSRIQSDCEDKLKNI
ncbi:MAG: hypothetical protein HQM12_24030, partial [SAR324 cluster bacterium]|nr:hypothetical protein [SAR324 cluster bacterium]